ncbi:MAG: SpoIIE family protein phosphatase [Pseudomonadota bacterium]
MTKLTPPTGRADPSAEMPANPVLADSRVLVVDDDDAGRDMLVRSLSRAGIQTIEAAADGEAGLAKVKSFQPDLVLLDVNMPIMDGHEMCRRLRADPLTADLPVLFQTGDSSEAERVACFRAGGSDYISKPIRRGELLARVTLHLQNRRMHGTLRSYARRVERELATARAMQTDLAPSPARVALLAGQAGLDIASHAEPSSELGGDIWSIFDLGAGRIGLMLADLSGHGVAAAINAFRLHTLIARQPPNADDPGAWLGDINRALCEMLGDGQFAAMFFGVLERDSPRLRYAACGGPSPIIADRQGARLLDASGLPLGVDADMRYDTRETVLPADGILLLYSDALNESRSPAGDSLGEAGVLELCESIRHTATAPPSTCSSSAVLPTAGRSRTT